MGMDELETVKNYDSGIENLKIAQAEFEIIPAFVSIENTPTVVASRANGSFP